MLSVKLFTMVKDEADIIEYWINYHGSLFGYRNLFIIDNMSTDGTYEKILKYKKIGVKIFRETDYREKGIYLTKLINSKTAGNYDIAFPLDIDEFIVHYDKTNNSLNPENTKKYIDEWLIRDFDKHEVFKCNYVETINTRENGYDNALLECNYGKYHDYKNLAKSFFNKHKWDGILDHGNHYNTDNYKLTDLCLVHYHSRNYEQMKLKIKNNILGLGYSLDKNELLQLLNDNKNINGNHHIGNMIKILENDFTLQICDINDSNKNNYILLHSLMSYFYKLAL